MNSSDCQATYVGETSRNLNIRLTEHKQATKNGDKTNHNIDWELAKCITNSDSH